MQTKISGAVDDLNVVENKAAIESGKEVRGKTTVAVVKRQNEMHLFGCKPTLGVLSETFMIRDLIDCTVSRLDRPTLSVELPKVFNSLLGTDASFELNSANTIMPLRLTFRHNISTLRFALILVNTKIEKKGCVKTLSYPKAAEIGEQAEHLMSDVFDCTDVVKIVDGTKSEIISAINTL